MGGEGNQEVIQGGKRDYHREIMVQGKAHWVGLDLLSILLLPESSINFSENYVLLLQGCHIH